MKKSGCAITGFAFAVWVLVGCTDSQPRATSASPATAATVPSVSRPANAESFVASGPVVVENQVDVAAQREGVVAEVFADVGSGVRKGQRLAQLDDRLLAAERDAAQAKALSIEADGRSWESEAKVAESDLARAEAMRKADLNTEQDYEHSRFKLKSTQDVVERERQNHRQALANLKALDLALEQMQVRAPFDGVVARRYVRVGQKVAIGERLFWVTAVAPLRVRFTLPERFLGRIRKGTELGVSMPELGDEKATAKVIQISPVIDPASGTIEVLAEFVGATGDLRPGMTANIHLDSPR